MSRKTLLTLLIIAIPIAAGIGLHSKNSKIERNRQVDEVAVRTVVESFGRALKNISLLSPTAAQDIEANYKDFLNPALLAQWKADPSNALGRVTSSPWPERIEIESVKQFGSGAYDVSGKIVDMTSTGIAGTRSVEIGVVRFDARWLITGISVGEALKEYESNGISFRYPEKLTAKYVFTQEWPPVVKIATGTYTCAETPLEVSGMLEIVAQRKIGDRTYCVSVKNEGAAGSVYASYTYTTPRDGKLVTVSFVLRYSNCANHDKEQSEACASEREAFDIDATVDRIVRTVNQ